MLRLLKKSFKNLQNLKYTNKLLLFITVILFTFGLVMIFSSSNIAAFMRYNRDPDHFFRKQLLWLALGTAGAFCITTFKMLKTKNYLKISFVLLVFFAFCLVYAYFNAPDINDSKGWVYWGPISFQPSEFVKVVLIMYVATFFEIKKLAKDKVFVSYFMFGIAAIEAGLVVVANDFGTAAIIALIVGLMYLLVPIKKTTKMKVVLPIIFLTTFVLMAYYVFDTSSFSRQIGRFTDFGNPCSEEKFYTGGNQVCNSIIAFNNGGVTGKGLGNSTQKYLYLPESHTDFIFAIVVEEVGVVGGITIILLYMLVIALIIRAGMRSTTFRGSMICYGVAIYIFLHIAVNLGGISGLIPLTGVPLPFLSYGGSYTICLIGALAMVQRVEIETKLDKLQIKQDKKQI